MLKLVAVNDRSGDALATENGPWRGESILVDVRVPPTGHDSSYGVGFGRGGDTAKVAYEAVLSEPLVLGFGAIAVLYIITRCRGVIIGWVVSAQRIVAASAPAHDADLVDNPL